MESVPEMKTSNLEEPISSLPITFDLEGDREERGKKY
jgi:hypothetical protein